MTAPLRLSHELIEVFRHSETPREDWRIGVEAEKFGLLSPEATPLQWAGRRGVEGVFEHLMQRHAWQPAPEVSGGPIISLKRGESSLTLEPACQLELSSAPFGSLAEVETEWRAHLAELAPLSEELGLVWLHAGFQPIAAHGDLAWVPKQRYPIMREYLPTQGRRGLDMMRRTATVQVNLDYDGEADAMNKLVAFLRLTPFLQAITLNAPFCEGKVSKRKSERLDVWLNMDPRRSGLITELWSKPTPRYEDYAAWAQRAGMFLVKRDGQLVLNTGQSFESFGESGFEGFTATKEDWFQHLGTLFPEVRLKSTLEVRGVDALPPRLALAATALIVGIAYDAESLDDARALTEPLGSEQAPQLQRAIAEQGLATPFNGATIQATALKLFDLAERGLRRGAGGGPGAHYLDPLRTLCERGFTPADALLERFKGNGRSLQEFVLYEAARSIEEW